MPESPAFLHDIRTTFDSHWSTISLSRSYISQASILSVAFLLISASLGFLIPLPLPRFVLPPFFPFLTRPWLTNEPFLWQMVEYGTCIALLPFLRANWLDHKSYVALTMTALPYVDYTTATVNESSSVLPPWLGKVCLSKLGLMFSPEERLLSRVKFSSSRRSM